MPPTLHDPAKRTALRARLESLRPDASARWGKMSVDQMLWHVNVALDMALGRTKPAPMKAPLPGPIMRFLVLNAPWPKGAPTLPEAVARQRYDFDAERTRCLALIDEVSGRRVDGEWPVHPSLGAMSGGQWSALNAKHLDHHLKQFGA